METHHFNAGDPVPEWVESVTGPGRAFFTVPVTVTHYPGASVPVEVRADYPPAHGHGVIQFVGDDSHFQGAPTLIVI